MKRLDEDLVSGLLLVSLGLFCVLYAQRYEFGTLARMGPGFFPVALGGLLAVLGLLILAPSLRRRGELPTLEWRTTGYVLGSFLVFSLTLPSLGLVLACFSTVVVSSLADRGTRWTSRLALAAGVTALTVLIFKLGLGMPVALWWGG